MPEPIDPRTLAALALLAERNDAAVRAAVAWWAETLRRPAADTRPGARALPRGWLCPACGGAHGPEIASCPKAPVRIYIPVEGEDSATTAPGIRIEPLGSMSYEVRGS